MNVSENFSGELFPAEVDESKGVQDFRGSLDVNRIMQPKTVTFASYRLSKLHHQMLVHIREELQAYVSTHREDIDTNSLISVPLFCSHYPAFRGNGALFFRSVKEFMSEDNVISFEWMFDPDVPAHRELFRWMQRGVGARSRVEMPSVQTKVENISVIVVHAYRCENDADKVVVKINPDVLPFVLYYGPGVGGTLFDRDVALSLSSSYSSRLYEMLMDWSTSVSTKVVPVSELRRLLCIPEKFRLNDIKRRVLDVAKYEIEQAGSGVTFDYELSFDSQYGEVHGARGRFPSNCVTFRIFRKESLDVEELSRKVLLMLLSSIADSSKSSLCDGLARRLVREGKDFKLRSKFTYYDKRVKAGKMSTDAYRNTLLKIVRETSGVDLRSDAHIRNAALAARRS